MDLVDVLEVGVRGAEYGTATVYLRGTTTAATVYADHAGTVRLWGTLDLDLHGSRSAYVNDLVDVAVYSSVGTLVRSFVEGTGDRSVEVISDAFTGADYTTSVAAVSKPLTLERVLDKAKTSFGAVDFNVLIGTTTVSLQAALAGLAGVYFNVKEYGAVGDGATDDAVKIQKAVNTAAAAGGVVFFPPGTYMVSGRISVPSNVSLKGCGPNASKIQITSSYQPAVYINGGDDGCNYVEDLGLLTSSSIGSTFGLLYIEYGSNVVVRGCFAGGPTCESPCVYVNGSSTVKTRVRMERCQMTAGGTAASAVSVGMCLHSALRSVGRIDVYECVFQAPATCSGLGPPLVYGLRIHARQCFFDASALTSGFIIGFIPTTSSTAERTWNSVDGCEFSATGGGTWTYFIRTYFYDSLDWFSESGNMTTTDGLISLQRTIETAGVAFGTALHYAKRGSNGYYQETTAAAGVNATVLPLNMIQTNIAVDCAAVTGGGAASPLVRMYSQLNAIAGSMTALTFGWPAATDISNDTGGQPNDFAESTSGYYYSMPGLQPGAGHSAWTMRLMRPGTAIPRWVCTAVGGEIAGTFTGAAAPTRTGY